ncbi:MAG: hypothetical protein AAFR62_05545, partial [Cyanobacteria bacterium J06629_2]
MLHQYEYSKSMQDLSWKNIGQSIVDGIAQLLDIDIAILYLRQVNPRSEGPEPTSVSLSDSDGLALKDTASPIPKEQQMISDCELEQHFFYQKLNAEVPQIDRDLLKLTVISQTELASDRPLRIRKYSVEPQQLPTSSYQAC